MHTPNVIEDAQRDQRHRELLIALATCRRLEIEAEHARIAYEVAAIRVRLLAEEVKRHD